MQIVKKENIEIEIKKLEELKNKHKNNEQELIKALMENGYNLCELGTSIKCWNDNLEVIHLQIKGKKYLNGEYIGLGGGIKTMGRVNQTTTWGIWMGYVKKVE